MKPTTFKANEIDFVVVPKSHYLDLVHRAAEAAGLDPGVFDHSTLYDPDDILPGIIGKELRAAREAAGLTQAQLAKRIKKSQSMVSAAERGTVRVGEPYARTVLKACNLPMDWKFTLTTTPKP